MKRHWVLAFATLVAIPRLASAQADSGWGPQFRVTPFIGVSPGITQKGFAYVATPNNVTISVHPYEIEHSSSVPIGVIGEARVWNRFALAAGVAWAKRDDVTFVDREVEEFNNFDGTTMWLVKANAVMRLRERVPDLQLRRLNATIFIGPAFIWDTPKETVFSPLTSSDAVSHWGMNFGAEGEMPLGNPRLSFTLGLEDYMIYWDTDSYRDRVQTYVQQFQGYAGSAVEIDTDKTHQWILRVGLSYSF
jgi:hypothetical protein